MLNWTLHGRRMAVLLVLAGGAVLSRPRCRADEPAELGGLPGAMPFRRAATQRDRQGLIVRPQRLEEVDGDEPGPANRDFIRVYRYRVNGEVRIVREIVRANAEQAVPLPSERGPFDDVSDDDQVIDAPSPEELQALDVRIAAREFDNQVFATGGGRSAADHRDRLQRALRGRVQILHDVCELDPWQVRKLELAGAGDIDRIFDRIAEARRPYEVVPDNEVPHVVPGLLQTCHRLHAELMAPFGPGSLFSKTIEPHLSFGQIRSVRLLVAIERLGGQVETYGSDYMLRLNERTLAEVQVRGWTNWSGLRNLSLESTPVTRSDLERIGGLAALERLDLGGTRIEDEGLAHLQTLVHLRFLDLRRTPVTDAGVVHVGRISGLQNLHLGGTAISGKGLAQLSPLRQLAALNLLQTTIQDADLKHLAKLDTLEVLTLDHTPLTGAGLVHLVPLGRLKHLGLARTKVTDAALEHLLKLPALESIDLTGTRVSKAAISGFLDERPEVRVTR